MKRYVVRVRVQMHLRKRTVSTQRRRALQSQLKFMNEFSRWESSRTVLKRRDQPEVEADIYRSLYTPFFIALSLVARILRQAWKFKMSLTELRRHPTIPLTPASHSAAITAPPRPATNIAFITKMMKLNSPDLLPRAPLVSEQVKPPGTREHYTFAHPAWAKSAGCNRTIPWEKWENPSAPRDGGRSPATISRSFIIQEGDPTHPFCWCPAVWHCAPLPPLPPLGMKALEAMEARFQRPHVAAPTTKRNFLPTTCPFVSPGFWTFCLFVYSCMKRLRFTAERLK